ncbi:probable DNA double-strand break repair Rad50 ATPase [Ruditapes philippinarum]|uniref:probable DNA double-strand break repair Rad50 ATPase n=1 Tax=Ruditapes philippinarum TaxID=129788 RepID=UPI00295BFEA2|nr:probable DNA double-strand break repair Rad50 ATPase [Ruditapes philippinarum]
MFTVVPKPEAPDIEDYQPAKGEPAPQIINHRQENQTHKKKKATYEDIKEQRDSLLESEMKYIKRIKELEKEKEDLLKLYEPTYKENKQLKSHLMHGPESQNIKKLKQEKKKILSELEIVNTENAELQDRVKELEKMFLSEKDYYREKKWREAIEKGRKRREEKDTLLSTQGPFASSRKPNKRDLKSVTDEEFEKQDAHDLHIDTLEKETQILLNKIRRMKQNKGSIDYAYFIGKGAITRNSSVAKAINEKLDKDLEEFENRLENLRQKTKQLKDISSEDLEVPVETAQIKQTGNKYFRTRQTQTNLVDEQIRTNPPSNNNNLGDKQGISKPIAETRNISTKESKKRQLMIKRNTPDYDIVHDKYHASDDIRTFTRPHAKEVTHESYEDQSATKQGSRNIRRTPDETEGFGSPIAEHWRHLTIKLNEVEKFGGKTPFAYRDKTKGRASVQSSSSRRQESMSYVPKRIPSTRPNSEEILSASAKSRRSANSEISKSSSRDLSPQLSANLESMSDIDELDYECGADDMLDTKKEINIVESLEKAQRKTTNLGEEIRFIPRQRSWETGRNARCNNEQNGRYANGFEPISRYRKTNKKSNDAKLIEGETKTMISNEKGTSDDQSEAINESGIAKDVRFKQRTYSGDKIKRNTQAMPSELRFKNRNTRDSKVPRAKGLTEDNRRHAGEAPDEEMVSSRNISAYDEVLADVSKQYKDHERRQMFQSRVQYKNEDKNDYDRTQQTRNINDEHGVDLPNYGVKHVEKTVFEKGQGGASVSSGKSREYIYNLDLL